MKCGACMLWQTLHATLEQVQLTDAKTECNADVPEYRKGRTHNPLLRPSTPHSRRCS